jgi:hypothetical protein
MVMKKLLLIPLLALLTSCDPAPQTGSDGYKFGEKQYTQTQLNVEVVVYPDRASLDKEVKRRGLVADGNQIIAFTTLYTSDRTRCTIHMVDPASDYVPEFVGHEFLHCVYGQWHSSNQQRN